ncbi:hypothetical protein ACGFYV_30695 [Streptomyces sp. NPDC048297]|uniref:hypothetical protein n=1 Tax=Streptomyces sp. NPDC048297 TaxID=3365531 RepID=UPI003718C551
MTGGRGGPGLPYEECKRQRNAPRPRSAPLDPGYAIPPFHPGLPPRGPVRVSGGATGPARVPRARRRRLVRAVDGAVVSALLTGFCVAGLVTAILVTAIGGRG